MCELGFGWPGLDVISLYNAGLPWFAAGALGVGVPAKALSLWLIWGSNRSRLLPAIIASITVFTALMVWFPSGGFAWVIVTKLIGSCGEWCGWLLLLSAGLATALDVAVLRLAFQRRITALSVPACWLSVANLISVAAGYAVAIWHDIHNPPVAYWG